MIFDRDSRERLLACVFLLALAIAALLLPGCGGLTGEPGQRGHSLLEGQNVTIYAENKSAWPTERFELAIAALNLQLTRDFAPKWNVHATVVIGPAVGSDPFRLLVLPDFEGIGTDKPTAQGIHRGHTAYANFKTSSTPSASCSHEVLEMLVDPIGSYGNHQVCDPVAPHAYNVLGEPDPERLQYVADFVFPTYWEAGSSGPWDQMGLVPAQGVPAVGGIQSE